MEIFNKLLQLSVLMKPLISVIIPTYNRSEQVMKALNSVLSQNYDNFEVLVCDDGSIDDTEEKIRSIKDKRIRYLKQENRGPGAARNLGLKNSKGDLIAFLDSDDIWLSNHLESCTEFFDIYPEASMVYTQNEIIFGKDSRRKQAHYKYKKREIPNLEKKERFRLYEGLIFEHYLESCISATPCTVVKKNVFDEIGRFNEDLSSGQDYEMWLRVSNRYRIGIVRKITVNVLAQGGSISETIKKPKLLRNRMNIQKSIKENCILSKEQEEIVNKNIKHFEEEISKL